MLASVLAGAALGIVGLVLFTGGDDGPADPAAELADRVHDILRSDTSSVLDRLAEGDVGVTADDLADADILCPRVRAPEAGDGATCRLDAGGTELELDVEFEADGSIQVVAVALAP